MGKLNAVTKTMIMLISCVAVFWIALAVVYCIPTVAMEENIRISKEFLDKEGLYPDSYVGNQKFDNFTVYWMLNEASQGG